VRFPIQHIEDNRVFSLDESVWAYYRVPMRDYTYRSRGEKLSVIEDWRRVFHHIEREMHLMIVPEPFDLADLTHRLMEEVPSGPLQQTGRGYIRELMERIDRRQQALPRPAETGVFLGVKLASRRQKGLFYHLKDFIRMAQDIADIEPAPILPEELDAARKKEHDLFQKMRSLLGVRRATFQEMKRLIAHSAYRGIQNPWVTSGESKNVRCLLTGEYTVEPQMVRVRQVQEGRVKEGWMQFLYLADLPLAIHLPGEEWLSWTHAFPMDISVRIRPISNEQAVKMLGKRKKKLKSAANHARKEGKTQDLLIEETYYDSAEMEKELQKGRDPLLRVSVAACMYAPTREGVMEYTRTFTGWMEKALRGMKWIVSPGDQWQAFCEFLPGGRIEVKDFFHWVKPEMIAGSVPNATGKLGDDRGMFIGYTGPLNQASADFRRPVFVHQALPAQGGGDVETKSLAVLVVGLTGFGKSFLASLLTYQGMMHLGARAMMFDVKGERGEWVKSLPNLADHVSLIRVGSDPKYRGMLDPFRVFEEDAPLYAKDFLMQLLRVDRSHDWHHVIQQAVEETAERADPSMRKVMDRIRELDERLFRFLSMYQRFPFSQLVFGDQSGETVSLDRPLNILQVDELALPSRDKKPEHYNEKEVLSVALMLPLTGFAHQVAKRDRNFNILWWEEAWSLMTSDQGKAAIDEGIRMGRYWNSETLIVTQNPTDLPDQLLNNIGMRFVFRTDVEQEAAKALEILGLEDTPQNRRRVQTLREGECFFRDLYGQVGRLRVDGVFSDLKQAFDTTPPLRKERVG